jgi:hypothetical protein
VRNRPTISRHGVERIGLAIALACTALLYWAATATAGPTATRTVYAPGELVPIPASIPHEAGDMVDRRIVPNLRWIAQRYPIYVTDGYSGPLLNGEHAGCDSCHTRGSDHHNGLAVDIVPARRRREMRRRLGGDHPPRPLGRAAAGQTRPALPLGRLRRRRRPRLRPPSHLSWNIAVAPMFQLAEWVEVFPSAAGDSAQVSRRAAVGRHRAIAARRSPRMGPQGGRSDRSRRLSAPRRLSRFTGTHRLLRLRVES